MGFPLYDICCFYLAIFNIVSLCLISVSLISTCLDVFLLEFILSAHLGLDYFLSHAGDIFNYNLFKNFLSPFIFLFFFWDPQNSNVGAFNIVPKVSEAIFDYHFFPLYPALQQLLPSFYLSAHLCVLLLPLIYYWFLLGYF